MHRPDRALRESIVAWVAVLAAPTVIQAAVLREDPQTLSWTGEGPFAGMAAVAWLPDPDHVIRGLIIRPCHGRPPGSDNRSWARAPLAAIEGIDGEGAMTKRLARRYNFAVIGLAHCPGDEHWRESGGGGQDRAGPSTRALLQMLEELATLGFPEFENAPLLTFGGSHAGVASWSIACALPDRVLAAAPNDPMVCLPGIMPRDAFEVPVYFSQGRLANGQDDKEERTMREARRHGARIAYSNIEGNGHEDGPTFDLVFPLLETAIRLRLDPAADPQQGPIRLLSIPLESGWLVGADFRSGLQSAAPYEDYPGDPRDAFWLPEKSLAHTYRGLSADGSIHVLHASPSDEPSRYLGMTRPHVPLDPDRPVANDAKAFDALARPGETIELAVEKQRGEPAPVTDWAMIEFFRDGESIGRIDSGAPRMRVTLTDSGRLFQTFTAVVTDGDGIQRATRYGATLAVEPPDPVPLLPPLLRQPLAPARPLTFSGSIEIRELESTAAVVLPPQITTAAERVQVRLTWHEEGREVETRSSGWTWIRPDAEGTPPFAADGLRPNSNQRLRIEARCGPGLPVAARTEMTIHTPRRTRSASNR